VPAISFTGSQAGVMTDESHSSARILDVRPIRVREELDRGRIVVLAGFQGVNPVCTENLIRVDAVMKSPKLAE
jgi:aspartate kinase